MKHLPLFAFAVAAVGVPSDVRAQIVPVYQVTETDATWTETSNKGEYQVSTSAEDYENEIWERPVKDNEWSDSGGVRTTSNLYYAYADLKAGGWGVGTSDGMDYLFARWEVVGGFQHEVGKNKTAKLLEGHYYFYARPSGGEAFAVEVTSGKDLGADFGDVTGKVNVYSDSNNDVSGTGVTTTFENGGDSFGGKQVAGEGRTNTSTFVTEVAVKLSDLGLTLADFNSAVDWAYIGVAVSNPSSPDSDLFANDFFAEAIGSGVEYDTIQMGLGGIATSNNAVPEPTSLVLLGMGLFGLALRSKRARSLLKRRQQRPLRIDSP